MADGEVMTMIELMIVAALVSLFAIAVGLFGVDSRDGQDWQKLPRP